MTIAFVIVLIAFILSCLVCYAGYVMLNSEVEVLTVRSDQNQREAERLSEELQQAMSFKRDAARYLQQLKDEQAKRAEVEAAYDEYRTRVNAAIDHWIGDR